MLNNTYTLTGAISGDIVYTKQYDNEVKSVFGYGNASTDEARILTVQHQMTKNRTKRHLVDLSDTNLDTSSKPAIDRVYLVVQHGPSTAPSTVKDQIQRLQDLLGTSGFVDSIIAGEL